MHRTVFIAALGASALLCARAEAELVRFTFTGTVIAVNGQGAPAQGEIGAPFTASFVFDTLAPDTDPGSNFGFYSGAVRAAGFDVGGLAAYLTREGGYVSVLNNGFVGDTLFYESVSGTYRVQASLTDIHRTAIDGDALPGDINFPLWENNRFYLSEPTQGAWTVVGEITTFARETVAACPVDYNFDSVVDSRDISAFITSWFISIQTGGLLADFNGDLTVNSNDISDFIAAWLVAVQGGC